jgi:hypothetical protein
MKTRKRSRVGHLGHVLGTRDTDRTQDGPSAPRMQLHARQPRYEHGARLPGSGGSISQSLRSCERIALSELQVSFATPIIKSVTSTVSNNMLCLPTCQQRPCSIHLIHAGGWTCTNQCSQQHQAASVDMHRVPELTPSRFQICDMEQGDTTLSCCPTVDWETHRCVSLAGGKPPVQVRNPIPAEVSAQPWQPPIDLSTRTQQTKMLSDSQRPA